MWSGARLEKQKHLLVWTRVTCSCAAVPPQFNLTARPMQRGVWASRRLVAHASTVRRARSNGFTDGLRREIGQCLPRCAVCCLYRGGGGAQHESDIAQSEIIGSGVSCINGWCVARYLAWKIGCEIPLRAATIAPPTFLASSASSAGFFGDVSILAIMHCA